MEIQVECKTTVEKLTHNISNGAKVVGFITRNEFGNIGLITKKCSYFDEVDFYKNIMCHKESSVELQLREELSKCYAEIADKEAIIAEYGRSAFTDMKGNFFICDGTVHFSGMGAVGASPIKRLV